MVEVVKVENKKQKDAFINFQYNIYKDSPNFVPPLKMDRYKLLDDQKNPFFKENDSALFLAYKNGEIVGRIAAIENKRHNETHNDTAGFFGFYESINDVEVAKALVDTAISWNKEKGYTKVIGPVNPHLNDDSPGFLLKGHDDDNIMLLAYTQPYYITLMESIGLEKAKDLYSYWVNTDEIKGEAKLKSVFEKVKKRHNITIRPINMKNFDEEYLIVQDIFNKAWENNWGQTPLTEEDFKYIASDLKSLVNTDFVLLAFKGDTPIGMAAAFPDVNEIFKGMKGSLFSLGLFRFLKYLVTKSAGIKRLRIFILGVLPEYENTGATAGLYMELINNARKGGFIGGEMAWILEDNVKMNKAAESFGAELVKTYRLYETAV